MTVRHEIAGRSASSGEATLCVAMAEDEGFEPSRLSSTRVRDARTRPLCESST